MQPHQQHHSNIEIHFTHCLKMLLIVSQYLCMAGSFIFFLLGYSQLSSCFFIPGNKSRETINVEGKRKKGINQGPQVSMFKPWTIHSLKNNIVAIYFGAVNLILAAGYFSIVNQSNLIRAATIGFSIVYLYRSKAYCPIFARFFLLLANVFFIIASIFLAIS
jgi:hypothetical protein